MNLGVFYVETGKRVKARQAYRKAIDVFVELEQEHPALLDYSVSVAGMYVNLGNLLLPDQPRKALPNYEPALLRLRKVLRQQPKHLRATEFLCNACSNKARTLNLLKRYKEALKVLDEAFALKYQPRQAELYFFRAYALAALGDHRRAVADAEKAVPGAVRAPQLFDLADVFALSAGAAAREKNAQGDRLADDYGRRAVALLEKAVEAGLFKEADGADTLLKDPDLDAIRGREDFKKLEAQARKARTRRTGP
jgi:tetratricopeptide (TPR) repeat protein